MELWEALHLFAYQRLLSKLQAKRLYKLYLSKQKVIPRNFLAALAPIPYRSRSKMFAFIVGWKIITFVICNGLSNDNLKQKYAICIHERKAAEAIINSIKSGGSNFGEYENVHCYGNLFLCLDRGAAFETVASKTSEHF